MRIDAHVHGAAGRLRNPRAYVAACRKAGIDAVVLIASKEDGLFETARKMGRFVIPVARVAMDRAGTDEINRLLDQGARGIKFIRPDKPYSDERYYPLYETVRERHAVAVFHTGYLMHDPDYSPRWRSGMDNMRASHMDTILRWVPRLRVLMAHFGNPCWDECWKIIWSHPTAYADLSGGTAIRRSMLFWRETFAPNGTLLKGPLEKVCFASDIGYFRSARATVEGVRPYIDFYERLLNEVKAPPDLREKVNSGNVLSLFNLGLARR